ncbi:MAG: hypothetical protein AB8G22_10475 [Saprospiraceae bacterium]
MKKFKFDAKGYLLSDNSEWTTLEEIRYNFVDSFPNSERRLLLFNNYLRFLYRFQDLVFPYFEQWIDGSFISQKENPKDIDIVTFLDYRVYRLKGEPFMDQFWSFSLEDEFIDSYIVEIYPESHEMYVPYQQNIERFTNLYGTSRADDRGVVKEKGFLKILFEKSL